MVRCVAPARRPLLIGAVEVVVAFIAATIVTACRAAPLTAAPTAETRPDDAVRVAPEAWAAIEALGSEPVIAPIRVELVAFQPREVVLRLRPSAEACRTLSEGRCHAGCFDVIAAAAEGDVPAITLALADPDERTVPIAESGQPAAVARAGFCYGMAPGHSGHRVVVARLAGHPGGGIVQLSAWRRPEVHAPAVPPIDLLVPPLGAPMAELFAAEPGCAETWEKEGQRCVLLKRTQALTITEGCEGCERWDLRFADGRLREVTATWAIYDINVDFFGTFLEDAERIALALERLYGEPSPPIDLATWADVEAASEPRPIPLQRRRWDAANGGVEWELLGVPGHHPGAVLRVTVSGLYFL